MTPQTKKIAGLSLLVLLVVVVQVTVVLRSYPPKTLAKTAIKINTKLPGVKNEMGSTEENRLSNTEGLENSFLVLDHGINSFGDKQPESKNEREAAQHLARALAWSENPARKLILIELESLLWNYLRITGSRQESLKSIAQDQARRDLFIAFRSSASDELEKLAAENPKSALVLFLKQL